MRNLIRIFGIEIDTLNRKGTVETINKWLSGSVYKCKYVVTPNVDHIVKLEKSPAFKQAYEGASMVVADGRPVVWAANLLGMPLPETVPGSDLVPAIFDHVSKTWNRELKVYLLGAAPGVAERAADKIHAHWPQVQVVGVYSPPMGFEKDSNECDAICERIASLDVELLVLGLGAPKQELWVYQFASHLPVKVALCVGATIDFLAGEKPRAPMWMRKFGLEWLHRMASEPRRLAGRYFHDAIEFPKILLREWKLQQIKTRKEKH